MNKLTTQEASIAMSVIQKHMEKAENKLTTQEEEHASNIVKEGEAFIRKHSKELPNKVHYTTTGYGLRRFRYSQDLTGFSAQEINELVKSIEEDDDASNISVSYPSGSVTLKIYPKTY